jgi:hypothetical protein
VERWTVLGSIFWLVDEKQLQSTRSEMSEA